MRRKLRRERAQARPKRKAATVREEEGEEDKVKEIQRAKKGEGKKRAEKEGSDEEYSLGMFG